MMQCDEHILAWRNYHRIRVMIAAELILRS